MALRRFRLYPLPFRFRDGGFTTAYGQRTHLDNVLLVAESDDGTRGFGEICRMAGNTPEPTAPDRVNIAAECLAPLLGADPSNPAAITARLGDDDRDRNNIHTAVETACLDLVSRKAGLPLHALLGGRLQSAIPTYRCISQGDPETMVATLTAASRDGYDVFQVKVGDTDTDRDRERIAALFTALPRGGTLLIDANGGWDLATATAMIGRHAHDRDPERSGGRVYWEEPCRTYRENREIARETGAAIVLDQCVTGPELVARACGEGRVAGIGIKCTMQGGIHKARLSRDICIAHGMRMKVDDSWAADVGTAASLHLAVGVPQDLLICGVDMRPYFDRRLSATGPELVGARFAPSDQPGLGVMPDLEQVSPPLACID